ncbi:hypothetical protein GOEFS_084_00040 [Gordonia effusa NBRC 100432]|uniref:Lipoprotein n=1 Tax=Gordonia effusa NBRC 100432 TaxID=1077974 RepID=H0R2W7_9ACTN|nr:hypothetical protein [Gordonia effusa]GAB19418.1 hypothetical protein GOEFS_084_00040 [Gordonia effusa NBRC 100432]
MESRFRLLSRSSAAALIATVGIGATACGSDAVPGGDSAAPKTTAAQSAVVADDECQRTPPDGHIDRSGMNLNFHNGDIRIALSPIVATPTPAPPKPTPAVPAPAPPPGQKPAVPSSTTSTAPAAPKSQCFGFARWGNSDPSVPPDSLLFSFKGPSGLGAQVSFFVGDLTGGSPPPAGGAKRIVPPLVSPINAQVGVSVNGKYYQATQCSLKITAMASARAAGFFQCPTATTSEANPFVPSDDVAYDSDESTPPPGSATPPTTTTPQTASLSGWFNVTK